MSIRIGLYDFFAYTIPGVFYLLVAATGLALFGVIAIDAIDWATVTSTSLYVVLLFVGAGYIAGLLLDTIAYRLLRLFYKRNSDAVRIALNQTRRQYPWLQIEVQTSEWPMLLRAVKSKSLDAAADVEQHNVTSIMLRNISLGLVIASVLACSYWLLKERQVLVVIIALVLMGLAFLALRTSKTRRLWFYQGVFDAFITHCMPVDEWFTERIRVRDEPLDHKRVDVSASDSGRP